MTARKRTTAAVGTRGEKFACKKLKERGFRILSRNVREKFAEIDIVAKDGETLCFVEVRTRRNTRLGHPVETVAYKKQQAIQEDNRISPDGIVRYWCFADQDLGNCCTACHFYPALVLQKKAGL